ncbi:MAG: hypothetical protein OQJ98_02380 [Candidatus Pacebacteria bacterium]|nr:hypothetical protein [Candidatus Paceibacterota bacterium]
MKMNFRRRNNGISIAGKGRRVPRSLVVVIISVLMLIGIDQVTLGALSRTLHTVGVPLWRTQAGILSVFGDLGSAFHDKRVLAEENDRLREEIDRLKLTSLASEVVRLENEDLREVLGRGEYAERIAAGVLARPNRTQYDTFIIDIGSRHGVTRDARVFAMGGIGIGTISEVYANTALVSLYSTPGRITDVLIGVDDPVATVATGRGGGDFEMHIPRGVAVSESEAVFFPGLDGGVVGMVGDVGALPTDSFQTVLVRSPINIHSIRVVTIEL